LSSEVDDDDDMTSTLREMEGGGSASQERTDKQRNVQRANDLLHMQQAVLSELDDDNTTAARLQAAYRARLLQDLRQRVTTDPDYTAQQFPNSTRILLPSASTSSQASSSRSDSLPNSVTVPSPIATGKNNKDPKTA